jgi:Mg2+-importing ATPase
VFDYATFAVLLWVMKVPIATEAGQALFRTGWFVESVLSASMVVLIIRTRRPAFRSRPGRLLTIATASIWAVTLALPYTPLGAVFKFAPLPWPFLVMVAVILAVYGSGAELAKRFFYRREDATPPAAGGRRRRPPVR